MCDIDAHVDGLMPRRQKGARIHHDNHSNGGDDEAESDDDHGETKNDNDNDSDSDSDDDERTLVLLSDAQTGVATADASINLPAYIQRHAARLLAIKHVQIKHHIPGRVINKLLAIDAATIPGYPKYTVRLIDRGLSLRPHYRRYVCCPGCFKLYLPKTGRESKKNGDGSISSITCSAILSTGQVCDVELYHSDEFVGSVTGSRPNTYQGREGTNTIGSKRSAGIGGGVGGVRHGKQRNKKKQSKPKFTPQLSYIYRSFIEQLSVLLLRPTFEDECEAWHQRRPSHGSTTLSDILDGWNHRDRQEYYNSSEDDESKEAIGSNHGNNSRRRMVFNLVIDHVHYMSR
jgi:hypothetical protein